MKRVPWLTIGWSSVMFRLKNGEDMQDSINIELKH